MTRVDRVENLARSLGIHAPQAALWGSILCLALSLPALAHPAGFGDLEEADQQVRVCQIQLLRDPAQAGAHARLTLALVSRARLVGDWTDLDQAGQVLARALDLFPEEPEVLWASTQLYAYQHFFDQALKASEQLIRLAPADPRGYAAAGDACLELGDLEAARRHYQQMGRLRRDFDALVRLARLEASLGRPAKALERMQEALGHSRGGDRRQWARVTMASYEVQLGRLERARDVLEEIFLEDPECDLALKHLGEVYALLGDYGRAESMYARAFALRPEPAYALAWAEAGRRAGKEALADTLEQLAERALRAHVEVGRVAYLRELATCYLRRGENLEQALALAVQDTAIRKDTGALVTLAWAFEQNGRLTKAWAMAQRAMARPDADAATLYRAASIASQLGKGPLPGQERPGLELPAAAKVLANTPAWQGQSEGMKSSRLRP